MPCHSGRQNVKQYFRTFDRLLAIAKASTPDPAVILPPLATKFVYRHIVPANAGTVAGTQFGAAKQRIQRCANGFYFAVANMLDVEVGGAYYFPLKLDPRNTVSAKQRLPKRLNWIYIPKT
ncbi:hypothetical protein [Methylomonas koyamae]|uniref:hypothetical protein n=1 Tax=Methylomonas koyamae TaxID=702114 RepID=UPI001C7F173A|nr:hypothetical protein [Methylomonas koyamae]